MFGGGTGIAAPYVMPWMLAGLRRRHASWVWDLETGSRVISLTFDDGPSRHTGALLDALGEAGVRAAFFVLGDRVRRFPSVARRIASEGHFIGLHGGRHVRSTRLSGEELRASLRENRSALEDAGVRLDGPAFFRPPFGAINARTAAVVRECGVQIAMMGCLPGVHRFFPESWEEPPEIVCRRVLEALRPGLVVALHDGEDIGAGDGVFDMTHAAETARLLITRVRGRGYDFAPFPAGEAS